jgi:hypothetical protein
MQSRREKGLCFNCDEKFALGHKCKIKQLYVLEILPDQEPELDAIDVDDTIDISLTPEISLHALTGIATPNTKRVTGLVNGKRLHILIILSIAKAPKILLLPSVQKNWGATTSLPQLFMSKWPTVPHFHATKFFTRCPWTYKDFHFTFIYLHWTFKVPMLF